MRYVDGDGDGMRRMRMMIGATLALAVTVVALGVWSEGLAQRTPPAPSTRPAIGLNVPTSFPVDI